MEKLERTLGLRLDPLCKVACEDLDYEEYLETFGDDEAGRAKAAEMVESEPQRMASLWQDPQDLIDCTSACLRALDVHLDPAGLAADCDYLFDYITEGWLRHDLADLLKMAEWAQVQGVRRVRLFAS